MGFAIFVANFRPFILCKDYTNETDFFGHACAE